MVVRIDLVNLCHVLGQASTLQLQLQLLPDVPCCDLQGNRRVEQGAAQPSWPADLEIR